MDAGGAYWSWWRSLLRRGGAARGDLAGGLTAALVLPTIEGGYGLIAFAPLGSEQAHLGFLLGATGAAVASMISLLAGLLQIGVVWSKLGRLARYVLYPVHAGYMNGSAVLITNSMAPHLVGLPIGLGRFDPSDTSTRSPSWSP